jgi:ATP-dependent Clp protease ATP-binding subunit ClpC
MGIQLTEQAQDALRLADYEARRCGIGYVGTEHLLLALLHEARGLPARALVDLGVDSLSVWHEIDRGGVAQGGAKARCHPQTPRLKTAIEQAKQEVCESGSDGPAGSIHLLLALLADPECAAAGILLVHGVGLAELRDDLRVNPGLYEERGEGAAFTALARRGIAREDVEEEVRDLSSSHSANGALSLDPPNLYRSVAHIGSLARLWAMLLRLLGLGISPLGGRNSQKAGATTGASRE